MIQVRQHKKEVVNTDCTILHHTMTSSHAGTGRQHKKEGMMKYILRSDVAYSTTLA